MVRKILTAGICSIAIVCAQEASAGTIIKLGLGDGAFDVEYSGGVLTTVDDGNAATTGDQNTDVLFSDFLSAETNIATSIASFSLADVTSTGDAEIVDGDLIVQQFSGGTFVLYDESNASLLEGSLTSSILAGSTGSSATGSLLTINLGNVTGGSLASQILSNSLSLSIGLNDVNGGAGFTTSAGGTVLDGFSADATMSIAAEQIPEPTSLMAALIAGILSFGAPRQLRRR